MKTAFLVAVALAARANARALQVRDEPAAAGGPGLIACGLGLFLGQTAAASSFCSSLLPKRTSTRTATTTIKTTTTKTTEVTKTTTLAPSSKSIVTPPYKTSTPSPTSKPTPPPVTTKSSSREPLPTPTPSATSTPSRTTLISSASPLPTSGPSCGVVGYTGNTAAYYFDASGTQNTFATCKAACSADSRCKSFGYGEANCLLFEVSVVENITPNPSSPYTFYDSTCNTQVVVKRQIYIPPITIDLPGGIGIGLPGLGQLSSACSCYIGTGSAGVTKTATSVQTLTSVVTSTTTQTIQA